MQIEKARQKARKKVKRSKRALHKRPLSWENRRRERAVRHAAENEETEAKLPDLIDSDGED